ncbi:MAG TPA: SDR family NAD(P)-dependent oxidoreductase [Candidatus Dormibacteraeota bacterium]|nr:SDR family NAD(P)-dependent oxidoreductase [Candidatus Dormibacteraeota bacterium]
MSDARQPVVLVTGASSGIGKACAEHLAARGFRVFGTQRRPPEESHGAVAMIAMDVDDDASVTRGVADVVERAGRLDAVVNNAGHALTGAVEDTAIDEARAQLETNFFGVLRVCRAALPIMRGRGGGHIVNISSLAGVLGLPFSGLYSASKFALEGMSESLRHEVRPFGIRVVLIEPGDFQSRLPLTRRTVAAAAQNPAYQAAFAASRAQQDKDEAGAPTPEPVAVLVERVLRDPSPALRYSVGMLGQRIVVPLKRLLPQRLFEWALRRALHLG